MEYWWILLSTIIIGAVGIRYCFKNLNFFKRNGVIHVPRTATFGIMVSVIFRRVSFRDFIIKLYNFNRDAKYFGFYSMTQPVIFIRDPELIKDTLVKNFEAFPNRRGFSDLNDPMFQKNLFSLRGQKWRDARNLLSPAFTSSKMKSMYTLMSECAVDFAKFLASIPTDKSDIDMKDSFTRYTNDVIATCAFGIKIDSMRNPTNEFYVYGKDASTFSGLRGIKLMLFTTFPALSCILNLKIISDEMADFFRNVIKTTITMRDAKDITRPDMIQLMMDIRGKRESERELSIDDMTALAIGFFFGGFDTSSTTMTFAAYEIAVNQDIQEKLRQEIDEVLEKSNGEVTYEVINELKYLDAVLNEVLRLYPPLDFLERLCDNPYELPPALPGEKPFTIRKGMIIWVPVYTIQRDKKYYDEPEKFLPERFLNDKRYHNSPYYLPFGLGPRMCIANRFALLEIKVLLFHLLARCELRPCGRTVLGLRKKKVNIAKDGLWLNIRRRNDMHLDNS